MKIMNDLTGGSGYDYSKPVEYKETRWILPQGQHTNQVLEIGGDILEWSFVVNMNQDIKINVYVDDQTTPHLILDYKSLGSSYKSSYVSMGMFTGMLTNTKASGVTGSSLYINYHHLYNIWGDSTTRNLNARQSDRTVSNEFNSGDISFLPYHLDKLRFDFFNLDGSPISATVVVDFQTYAFK